MRSQMLMLLLLRDRASTLHEYPGEVELLEHRGLLVGCMAGAVCCGSRGAKLLQALEHAQVLEHT